MKIGIDSRASQWYRGTGIGTYTYQLIKSLNKIDSSNKYLLFTPSNTDFDINFKSNFIIKHLAHNDSTNVFWKEVNIPNILKNKEVDIYHVPQNGVGLPKDKNCKFVITLHDIIPYKMPETCSDNYLKIFNEKIPSIVASSDAILTVSNYSKKDIVEAFHVSPDKVFVTYLGAEDIYKPINKNYSKEVLSKSYSITGDYILYVGGFSPRKNILGVINAFEKLTKSYKKDIKLIIAGSKGKSYPLYQKRVDDLNISDKVMFPGFIQLNHMPLLYSAASLMVYPSFYEGFGLPPIEAMSCGCPVIASNTTSVYEILNDFTITVNPNDENAIYNSMLNVLNDEDLKRSLIKNGFNRVSTLSWENTAMETINAYEKIYLSK